MFNKSSWNNRRGGYLKPPDTKEQEKKSKLLEQMKATVLQKKEEAQEELKEEAPVKMSLMDIAKQEHFDLDASVAEEAQKQIKVQQPKVKGKFNPIIIPIEKQDEIVKNALAPKPYQVPEKADPSVDDCIHAIDVLLYYFNSAHKEMLDLQGNITKTDLETSDLLHSIELTEFEEDEKSAMTDTLKEVRVRRRSYKWRLEYFLELDAYATSNKQFINALQGLKTKLDAINARHKRAMYQPRIRTDLKPNPVIQALN